MSILVYLYCLPAAKESIVLMENPKGILPLDLSKYESVAIIGPCADTPLCYEGK